MSKQKGEVVRCVVVRTKKGKQTLHTYNTFSDNAVVLIDSNKNPIGTRVLGPVTEKQKRFLEKLLIYRPF